MSAAVYSPRQEELADAVNAAVDEFQRNQPKSTPTSYEIGGMIQKENPSWKINDRKLSKSLKKELKGRTKGEGNKTEVDDDVSIVSSNSTSSKSSRTLISFAKSVKNLGGKKNYEDDKSTKSVTKRVSKLLRRKSSKGPSKLNITVDVEEDKKSLLPEVSTDDVEEEVDLFVSPTNGDQLTADLTNASIEQEDENVTELQRTKDLPSEVQTQVIEETEVSTNESEAEKVKEPDTLYVDDNDGKKSSDCACNACTIL